MALIKCEECGKEISNKASSCPNCGCPIKQSKKNHKKRYDDLTKIEKRKLQKEMMEKGVLSDGVRITLRMICSLCGVLAIIYLNFLLLVISLLCLLSEFIYLDSKKRRYYYEHKE